MNPLTLGLAAAAITLVIVRGRSAGRGRELALPADAGFTDYGSAEPINTPSASSRSTSSNTSSSASDAGRAVQRALRAYATGNNRYRSRELAVAWHTDRALNDGIIGPATTRAWDAVRQQYNAVCERTYPAALFMAVKVNGIPTYNSPANLIGAASRIEAAANDANYWTRLNSLSAQDG